MKHLLLLIVLSLVSCQTPNFHALTIDQQSSYMRGEADELGTVDGAAVSFLAGHAVEGRAVGMVADVSIGKHSGTGDYLRPNLTADNTTLSAGGRYYIDTGSRIFQPYLTAGLSRQWTDLSYSTSRYSASTSANCLGTYVGFGFDTRVSESVHLHLGYRSTSNVEPDLGAYDIDMDRSVVLIGIGVTF
jgi:opacity protein-like surface antigen